MTSITGIPAEEVGTVVQDFVDDGAERVVIVLRDDGTYTITESEGS